MKKCLILLILIFKYISSQDDIFSFLFPENHKIEQFEPNNKKKDLIKEDLLKDDLPDASIYFEGWVKYSKTYDVQKKLKNSFFFKNSSFKPNSINIPSETSFYCIVYKDNVNFLSSKELVETQDSLVIDFIKTIPEDFNYIGGVREYEQDRSCLLIDTVKPSNFFKMSLDELHPSAGKNEAWIICPDKQSNKKILMDVLIKLKLKKQHNLGAYVSKNGFNKNMNQDETIRSLINPYPAPINQNNQNVIDGKWIVLQEWSQCTLKCGGGLSYQHLLCVPPKQGGKPCEGPSIRTKPCNTQPCPGVSIFKQVNLPNISGINNPIVKVMSISSRPQRYDKCYLKESDALMARHDGEKIPVRVIMNNKSVSIYQDESLHSNFMTLLLKDTNLFKSEIGCFILKGSNQKVQICGLGDTKFVEEWTYDFNLFKYQCREKRDIIIDQIDKEIYNLNSFAKSP